MDQTNLLQNMVNFNNKSRPKKRGSDKKKNTFDIVSALYESWELTLNAFKSEIFQIKATKGEGLKITNSSCTNKSIHTSKNLLNEIRQIICPLYRAREFTKKVYNNIMNSTKL